MRIYIYIYIYIHTHTISKKDDKMLMKKCYNLRLLKIQNTSTSIY